MRPPIPSVRTTLSSLTCVLVVPDWFDLFQFLSFLCHYLCNSQESCTFQRYSFDLKITRQTTIHTSQHEIWFDTLIINKFGLAYVLPNTFSNAEFQPFSRLSDTLDVPSSSHRSEIPIEEKWRQIKIKKEERKKEKRKKLTILRGYDSSPEKVDREVSCRINTDRLFAKCYRGLKYIAAESVIWGPFFKKKSPVFVLLSYY